MKQRVTFSLSEELIQRLKEKSTETMIPQSRLVEEAITQLLQRSDDK